ncbi:hypothetical protein AJ78_00771 [Emergomyces pasteurianus Ep9510]|uniref:Life-span regulatory factor domain-containing protein n=1 Tax=Emergomyces pasteurianus Ep9510 TaxID=1447872 RepID=A0A1J9PS47_9EURO|nr:hypothetical protein AJ78_00771 [Emergomyces pasteurianus Ep9510]
MATAWSLDFCLVCDRQTLGGAYCSQACRLAEMDGSAPADSEPSSPTTAPVTTTSLHQSPWVTQRMEGQPSALHLGPAIDFGGYKFPSSSAQHQETQQQNIYPFTSTPSLPSSSRRGLSPSSSQTSLSSLHSVSSNSSTLSGQARSELENYSGSFDKVRDWKRRRTAS